MRLGAADVNLDWPIGLPQAGYSARTAVATGTLHPLHVRALVASAAGRTVCLLSIETVCVDADFTFTLRRLLADRYALQSEAVMVTATHTHSAPAGTARFPALGGAEAFLGAYAPDRVQHMLDSCVEAVAMALDRQQNARLTNGTGVAEDVGRNRRDPEGQSDPAVPFVCALDESQAPVALVYSFPCHPTVLDARNTLYSGDLAGVTALRAETRLPGLVLPLTGAAGDISTRFTRRDSSAAELDRLAGTLANALMGPTQPDTDDTIACASARVFLPLKAAPSPEVLSRSLQDAHARVDRATPDQRRLIESEIEGLQVALAAGPRPDYLETEVQTLRIGRSLIIGLPGELFVRYGLTLRDQLAPAHVLVAGYANDYIGYVPNPETEGGYEADSALVDSTAGQRLVHAALQTATACLTK